MKFMRFAAFNLGIVLAALIGITSPDAWAASVTFGATAGASTNEFVSFIENGMTIAPVLTTPTPSSAGPPHFDHMRGDAGGISLGASDTDNNAVIHRGNAGEKVLFTFSGGAFDLLSVDLEAFILEAASLTVTFNASSGATLGASTVGTIDFSVLSGWSNITSFTMGVPLGDYTCAPSRDCSTVSFDNVVFQEAVISPPQVPEPMTLALLAIGLVGLGLGRYRKAA